MSYVKDLIIAKEIIVKKQTNEICLEAVKQNGWALKYVKKQTNEICLEAVKQNGWALEYVKKQTNEICLEAVKQDGLALKYVKDQTEDICLAAVRQNGYSLHYVKEHTGKICLAAIKQNGKAIRYVKDQTEEICLEAVKQNNDALYYIKKQTENICLEAIKGKKNNTFDYVKKQTKNICLEGVKQNINSFIYVNIKHAKFIYDYLKSINFKNLDSEYSFIINKDINELKMFLRRDVLFNNWCIKYTKQSLELCKLAIYKLITYTLPIPTFEYVGFDNINFKKSKLCLQIIKTYKNGFRYINKQYILNILL